MDKARLVACRWRVDRVHWRIVSILLLPALHSSEERLTHAGCDSGQVYISNEMRRVRKFLLLSLMEAFHRRQVNIDVFIRYRDWVPELRA